MKVWQTEDIDRTLAELIDMDTRPYFNTKHWQKVKNNKLEEQPMCEACGKRHTSKVLIKNWDTKGRETLDDVWALCNKCSVVKGTLISHEEVEEVAREDIIRNMDKWKEVFTDIAIIYIKEKAIQLLAGHKKSNRITNEDIKKAIRTFENEQTIKKFKGEDYYGK